MSLSHQVHKHEAIEKTIIKSAVTTDLKIEVIKKFFNEKILEGYCMITRLRN
jgi:hypothetical protein